MEVDIDMSFHPEQKEEEEMLYCPIPLPQEEKKESNGHVDTQLLHVSSKQSLPARKKRKSNQSIPKGYMLVTFDDTISAKELKALVAQNQNIKPPLRGNLRHQLLMPVGCWIDLSAVLSDQHFDSFLEINKQLRFEHLDGRYYIEPIMASRPGEINAEIARQVGNHNFAVHGGLHHSFDSSTEFLMNGPAHPNDFLRPDSALMNHASYMMISREDHNRHRTPILPDFVAEVRSASQTLADQQAKMVRWIEAGVETGMLVDPFGRVTYRYATAVPPIGPFPAGVAPPPLLPAPAAPVPGHPTVLCEIHAWPAQVVGVLRGPAGFVVNGVGFMAGFVLNHGTFPEDF